jgi:nucleoside-diphosphate-sugar epimerase
MAESLLANTDYKLYLLMRDRQKFKLTGFDLQRVTIIEDTLHNIENYAELLGRMTYVISAAACWGGDDVYTTNLDKTIALFNLVNPDICERAIYFSTASILDQHNQVIKEAGEIGTGYIRSKYLCLQALEASPIAERLISVFPTLVFGGAADKPYSHLSAGLKDIAKYVRYLRYFKTDGSLHFVHSSDIAQVITSLLTVETLPAKHPARFVLGMERLTADVLIDQASIGLGMRPKSWRFDLTPALINLVIKVFKIQMAEWDYFCLQQRHFTYDVVRPETFGLKSHYPQLKDLFAEVA